MFCPYLILHALQAEDGLLVLNVGGWTRIRSLQYFDMVELVRVLPSLDFRIIIGFVKLPLFLLFHPLISLYDREHTALKCYRGKVWP
jgi:hypothetical protein